MSLVVFNSEKVRTIYDGLEVDKIAKFSTKQYHLLSMMQWDTRYQYYSEKSQ